MRDVLFLSIDDWANVGTSLAVAGRFVGMDCVSVVFRHHPFGYIEKSILIKDIAPNWVYEKAGDELDEFSKDFKAIVIMHSRSPSYFGVQKRQRWAVYHSCRPFQDWFRSFNKCTDVQFPQTPDLFGRGLTNEQWLIPPVDVEYIKPVFSELEAIRNSGITFRHNPRDVDIKGSSLINKVMENFKGKCNYEFSSEFNLWPENIERMSKCDIYIVSMGEGVWGLTALEAAALGKIVVVQFDGLLEYEKEYGCECPFVVVKDDLGVVIEKILSFSPERIVELQKQTREWVLNFHSYKPTGLRLKKFLID